MSAQEILKMIEAVDPSDTAKLDEIDEQVNFYCSFCHPNLNRSVGFALIMHDAKYTRSRDALKAIRPKGWYFVSSAWLDGTDTPTFGFDGIHKHKPLLQAKRTFATEELAELHAIIQAIEYERNANELA